MIRRTTCNRDCPDACSILATVEDGVVTRIEGDPDHPVTRGFLCYRTNKFLSRQYSRDRLTTPLVRQGGTLRAVSWDDALDRVAETMLRIKSESGGAAILHYRSGGSLGILKALVDYVFERFGPVTVKRGDICSGAGEAAQEADFGVSESHDLFDLRNSRTIVLWGKNVHVSSVHLVPLLREARADGATVVQVDPVRHRGADLADLYLQPAPGGDIALGLGVARRLFETGGVDPDAASYCDHLDAFRSLAFSRSEEAWAALADVPLDACRTLADTYARGPSSILVGWGLQRRARGATTVRVLDALGAISGNLGVPGGGVSFYFGRRSAFDTSFCRGIEGAPRTLAEPLLGREILEAADPPVRMVWVTAGNPVAMLPDSRTVKRALETREMTVVVDSFLTDTAAAADVVLPTTTLLEDDDLLGAYGHHWLAESRPVVEPPDGVRGEFAILRGLARRIGLEGLLGEDLDAWKRRALGKVAPLGASLEALREGAVRSPLADEVLFRERRFPTATGRVNLVQEAEVEPARGTPERPLLLMAFSTRDAQSSQWARPQSGPAEATVHPDAVPGLEDGARARIESEIGALVVRLRHDPRQRTDVVLMEKGGWLSGGRCANALVRARETDAGGGAVYYDTPVRIVPEA